MDVHLIDGTYELFRHFYAPGGAMDHLTDDGRQVGAVRGVVGSVLTMLEQGATHLGVATDHVIESFRNDLWPDYKTGEGIDPELRSQFLPLEEALASLGVAVWAMVEVEADDALGAAAAIAAADDRTGVVKICTPDKDLGQCVGGKVVQYDRRNDVVLDAAAVEEKFGVPPSAIPDYLGLVGDTADGFPGLKGWGAKSSSTLLARYGSIEQIPLDENQWDVKVRGASKLAATLRDEMAHALLFKRIATLELDASVGVVDDWEWTGPRDDFLEIARSLDATRLAERAASLAAARF